MKIKQWDSHLFCKKHIITATDAEISFNKTTSIHITSCQKTRNRHDLNLLIIPFHSLFFLLWGLADPGELPLPRLANSWRQQTTLQLAFTSKPTSSELTPPIISIYLTLAIYFSCPNHPRARYQTASPLPQSPRYYSN